MKIYNFEDFSKRAPKKIKKSLKFLLPKKGAVASWLFRVIALGIAGLALLFIYFSFSLPDPNTLLQRTVAESTKILDRNGELLYEIHGEAKRTLVTLDDINPYIKNATVAIEDKDFYKHKGVSFRGILRAALKDVITVSASQGGSTITQQFVKNALLTSEKRVTRKLKELILSIELEARYSKDEILQLYLNEIPYGRNAYGIEAASQTYFNKHAKDLTLAESAYLAALPQAPTFYNPAGPNRERLDGRQKTILTAMQDQGYISEEEKNLALEEKVEFKPVANSLKAPHFVLYIQSMLAEKYGESTLQEGGIKVTTTLDKKLQDIAESAVKEQAQINAEKYNAQNASLVAIDPKTGQILAMVGSKDYFGESYPEGCKSGKDCLFDPAVNVALTERQPGSSFKPYVYLTGFKEEHKMAPATMLFDVVTNFGTYNGKSYIPKNYSGKVYGPLSARQALAGSLNIPAVKMLALVGVENAVETAKAMGIKSPLQDCGLSLVLGGCEVRLLDHTNGYATIANNGIYNPATGILKVESRDGEVLEEFKDQSKRAVDEQANYLLVDILKDNNARSFIFGANNSLNYSGREVACKTGTTNDFRDGWTMCATPQLAVGVWAGNNRGTMKAGADGSKIASPIVRKFITEGLKGVPAENFTVPSGIQKISVDTTSGKLPSEFTPSTKEEVFASYSVPEKFDDVHVAVRIDNQTGLPAGPNTLPQNTVLQYYTIYHSEQRDNPAWEEPVKKWMQDNGILTPPFEIDTNTTTPPGNGPKLSILSPQQNDIISTIPFEVVVNTESPDGVSRVDLLIDGTTILSKNNGPYVFQVNKNISDGPHMLAVRSTDSLGRTSDLSLPITIASKQLLITNPIADGEYENLVSLEAVSGKNLGSVSFYVNGQNAGTANSILTNGQYVYSMLWVAPGSGEYTLEARSSQSTSKSIKFNVKQ